MKGSGCNPLVIAKHLTKRQSYDTNFYNATRPTANILLFTKCHNLSYLFILPYNFVSLAIIPCKNNKTGLAKRTTTSS